MKIRTNLALIAFLAAASATLVTDAGAETRIMFVSDKAVNGSFDLFSMRTDGTDLVALTATATVSEWAPALSPNGQRVAMVNRSAASPWTGTLQIMPIAGGAATVVPSATGAFCVQWRDESTLLYLKRINASGSVGTYQVRSIKTDGTGDALLYSTTFDCFVTGCDSFHVQRSTGRIYLSDLVNGNQPSVTLSGLLSGAGTDIAYARCTDVDTGATQVLLVDHYDPAVSPDGTKFSYCADHGSGRHRLYVRALGNDHATQLRLSDTFCGDPEWSPDSTWIAFTRAAASSVGATPYLGNITRVPVTGGTGTNLTGTLTAVSGRCAHPLIYFTACAPIQPVITTDATNTVLTWPAVPFGRYQVQYSSDLAAWKDDLPNSSLTAPTGATALTFTTPRAGVARRFFRVLGVCP